MKKIINKILYYGVQTIEYYFSLVIDKIRRVDFAKKVDTKVPGGEIYEATHRWMIVALSRYLKENIVLDDAIIDVGCGKGAMLRLFTKFPFKKITGLEYSEKLSNIANNNMKRLGIEDRCGIINIDAGIFDMYSEYNYFYLYNPFGESVMELFLTQVKSSLDRKPRKIVIIYNNPVCGDMMVNSGFYEKEDLADLMGKNYKLKSIKIYSNC